MPANHKILFPKPISNSFKGILERGLLTPTFFSALLVGPVLPKQFETLFTKITKKDQRFPLLETDFKETFYHRFGKEHAHFEETRRYFNSYWDGINRSHTLNLTSEDGIERVELTAKKPSDRYVIHYAGNAQDAMNIPGMYESIQNKKYSTHNHIFWNYPGVEESGEFSLSVYEVIAAGLEQVESLLARGIPAQNITLLGRSIGGGFVTQIARRLPETTYRPNIDIDRSFASISAIPLVAMRNVLDQHPRLRPFYSAILACALLGLSTGFVVSGLIATVGLLCATLIATVGYLLANSVQLVQNCLELLLPVDSQPALYEWLDKLTMDIDTKITQFALLVHQHIFNVLASIIGLVVAVPGLIVGSLLGVVIGGILALQTLFTETPPLFFPLYYAFKWATFVAHIEMDSVAAINHILANTTHTPTITSTNVEDDHIIPPAASLNNGLSFATEHSDETAHNQHCNFFWYKRGGHNGVMAEHDLGRCYQSASNTMR